jgi:Flp pilus assembly protein TadG
MTTPTQSGAKKCVFSSALSSGLHGLWNDQRGTIAVMTGLCATVLVGFAALAIDASSWQVAQHSMQGAADAAAYSAGVAYNKGDGTSYVTQAKGITAAQGYVDGQNGATVAVNKPPTSGSHTGTSTAIEVVITQPQPRFLAGLFLSSNPTVTARAVATIAGSGACILALDRPKPARQPSTLLRFRAPSGNRGTGVGSDIAVGGAVDGLSTRPWMMRACANA